MCAVDIKGQADGEQVMGRVRDQVFTVTITTSIRNDPAMSSDALKEKNKPKVKIRPSASARPPVPPVPPVPPAPPAASAAAAPPAPPAAPMRPTPRRAARIPRLAGAAPEHPGHPGYPERDAVYYYLAESLARTDKKAEAIPLFERLLEEFEQSEHLLDARKRLEELKTQ